MARSRNAPMAPSVELSLAAASTDTFKFYQLEKPVVSCFKEVWLKVSNKFGIPGTSVVPAEAVAALKKARLCRLRFLLVSITAIASG